MLNKALFSSQNTAWATPQAFFDRQAARYGPFDLDVCAVPANAKCQKFLSPSEDGLSRPWHGVCWMNPPYGKVRRVSA